ncbi:HAMP domain-containing sensor histidine kinase [soil metagenome]
MAVFSGLVALAATLSLAIVTYASARSSLLDQRTESAKQQAIDNAKDVSIRLRSDPDSFGDFVTSRMRLDSGGFNLILVGSQVYATGLSFPPEALPMALRASVEAGAAGIQRFTYQGRGFILVGVPMADIDTDYYEAFPLAETERSLRSVLLALAVGTTVTVLLASGTGMWTSRRLLRPLRRITDAAGHIADGDLATRVAPERDPDLEPLVASFNGMADAVQARIDREARFASDVSHELRSPITALTAATDVINGRLHELPERTRQAVDVVVNQVRRFDSMVLDLLELSRIDAGAATLDMEVVDLAELVRRIAGRYGHTELPVDVTADAPAAVPVDRVRFERIIANLLENASNHAGGPVRVTIERAGDDAVVAVEDAGPGVPPDERERIFERFNRGSSSRRRIGTGLGLALVAEHTAAHGGTVHVETAPTGGSRFVVRLPADEGSS